MNYWRRYLDFVRILRLDDFRLKYLRLDDLRLDLVLK